MPAVACTNPAAINYNPQATSDDGSCLYLEKIGGVCYAFQDLADVQDQSWTLSWSLEGDNWAFFHDYTPDYYIQVRKDLYTAKNSRLFKHNSGLPGVYYGGTPKPFFVDVIFNSDQESTLNTIRWVNSVLNSNGGEAPFDTLTHITVWNSQQCTGRVALSQVFTDLEYDDMRKTQGTWSFDNFRDKVISQGTNFLQDIFDNFAVNLAMLSDDLPWFERQLMEDFYFVVRFEFDNSSGKKLYLEETNVDVNPSYR